MKLTVNTIPNNSICFVGDSVISSYNVEDSPHVNTWIHRLANDPAYGFDGDVMSESYAGRIMATDMQNDTDIDNFAAKLASFNTNTYWFEGGFNDYGFAHFENRTDLTLALFGSRMFKLLTELRTLKPSAKFYVSSIVPAYYEGPNLETVVDPLATPLVGSGPTADDYRLVQKLVSNSISNCEFVDFVTPSGAFSGIYGQTEVTGEEDLANGTTDRADIFYQYSPDGIHPNIAGQIKFCDAVKSRCRLLSNNTFTPFPLEITTATLLDPFQTNLTTFETGISYSHQLITLNGLPSYTYTLVTTPGQALPAGITLSSSGLLSGIPTAPNGTPYTFTIRSTEAGVSPRTVDRTFTGFITEVGGVSPIGTSSISYGTVVTSDLYDDEWIQEVVTPYSLATKTTTLLNPVSNPSPASAGLFCYFQSGPSASANSTASLSFEAKGTGTIEIIIFNSSTLSKVWRQTFTLSGTLTTYTATGISLPKETEYRLGIFFTTGADINGSVNATDVEISKNFGLKFEGSNFYGLTGNYTRIRWDKDSILGNGYENWTGRKNFANKYTPAKKHLRHSSWAFMRLKNCNASKLIVEYVNSSDFSLPISVFENNSAMNSFITYQADNNQYYVVKRNESALSNAGISRTIEVVSSNQSLQVNASNNYVDHTEFTVGAYIRAIYIEEGASFTLDVAPHPESVSFIGDSIINTSDPVTFVNNPSAKLNWIHDIRRNGSATYNYPGDIFTDSSGARSLGQDLQDPTRRENLVQRLVKMGAKKIYIEGSTNDFFPTGNGRTYVTSTVFKSNYKAFVDRLLAVIPGCKIFIHVQFKFGTGYESVANSEGLTFAQWRQKVREIYNENYTGNAQVELVDFDTVWTTAQAESTYLYNESGQYIHPKYTAGQAKLAEQLIARSNIEAPLALSFGPGVLPNITVNNPFSQTLTASNGTSPYTFSVAPGSTLPGWLTLTGNVLSGTAPASVGSSNFSIRVTDNVGATKTVAYTLNVVASNMILTPATSFTPAVRNVAYSQAITVTGTSNPISYSATGLPTGLSINASSGLISGTPAIGNTVGTYSVTITANDGYNSQNFVRSLVLNGAALTVTPSTITDPQVTIPFSQVFSTSGGTAPYTYTVSGQPTGLTMSSSGTLSGTPSVTGAFTFTVTATDSVGNVGTRVISTTVQAAPPVVDYTVTINGSNQVIIGGTRTKPGGGLFSSMLDSYPSVYYKDGAGPLTYMTGGNVTWAGTSATATTTLNATLAPGGLAHVPGRSYYLQGHIFAPTSIDGVAITAADPDINTP